MSSTPATVAPDFLIDSLDPEQQHKVFETLHFKRFVRSLELKPCRCGTPLPVLEAGPTPEERRKIVCGGCEKFLAWLPKLRNKDKRPSSSTGLAVGTFCQCCRKTGVSLTGHHVIEVDEGGSNAPENIWTVCDACHQVIHALRRLVQGSAA